MVKMSKSYKDDTDIELNKKTVNYEVSEFLEENDEDKEDIDEELEEYIWLETLSNTISCMKKYKYDNGIGIGEYLTQQSLCKFMSEL